MPGGALQSASAPSRAEVPAEVTTWRVDSGGQTIVLAAVGDFLPCVLHWGAALPDEEDLAALAAASAADITGGTLDLLPDLSLCPEVTQGFPGKPGLFARDGNGAPVHPSFRRSATDAGTGPGPETNPGVTLVHTDASLELRLTLSFTPDAETGVIVARSLLEARHPLQLEWLAAPVLPGPQASDNLVEMSGRWCGEFRSTTVPWTPGARLRESRLGRGDHTHFPGVVLPGRGTTNTRGEAWALHYGWSGGHRMVAEELPDGRRQLQFGHAMASEHGPGTRFETAPLVLAYSAAGSNGCAVAFQRHLRDRVVTWPRPVTERPVHYNCWEAVYFDHDLATLREIAAQAADLGAERFVLDDGWFGRRDDDTSSLGDWQVDPRKYPGGLGPLIDHVHGLGMGFGLWVEPEMINEDSDLYRAHPDWVLGPAEQPRARHQLVLDMARPEVREHLFACLSKLLAAHPIDYLKWDHNRVLPFADAAQTRGTLALMERIRGAFPQTEIESCASGGGRIDFGILARCQRVWLSDSNDALERLRIQHEAALFLPAMVTGSHVGPRRCHTSGRVLDIAFRAWVAAQRHLGFEMDPRELDDRERAVLRRVTDWWKANRAWLALADILRIDSDDPAVIAEQHLARDGARFVVFAGQAVSSAQASPRPLRLTGLTPDARYRLRLVNGEDVSGLSRGTPVLKTGDVTASGAWLEAHGVALPVMLPETMLVLEGERL